MGGGDQGPPTLLSDALPKIAHLTTSLTRPPDHAPTAPKEPLSLTKVVAGALATVTATAALSYLGVAGTLVGAAVASVVTVVGNHLYSESIQRTRATLLARTTGPDGVRVHPGMQDRADRPSRRTFHLGSGRKMLLRIVAVFVAVLSAVTVFELVVHKPLSEVVQGRPGHGTTVFGPPDTQGSVHPATRPGTVTGHPESPSTPAATTSGSSGSSGSSPSPHATSPGATSRTSQSTPVTPNQPATSGTATGAGTSSTTPPPTTAPAPTTPAPTAPAPTAPAPTTPAAPTTTPAPRTT